MAIYLGSQQVALNMGGVVYRLILGIELIRLLSSDGYILTDSNGVYLLPKEDN